jgi:hypothetical protein
VEFKKKMNAVLDRTFRKNDWHKGDKRKYESKEDYKQMARLVSVYLVIVTIYHLLLQLVNAILKKAEAKCVPGFHELEVDKKAEASAVAYIEHWVNKHCQRPYNHQIARSKHNHSSPQ